MNRGLLRATHPTILSGIPVDGWIPFQGMLIFSSVDQAGTSTSCGQMTVIASGFDTSLVKVGDRIKCDHNGVTKYFIVVAKSTSTSIPTLTLISKVNQADLSAMPLRNAAFSPVKNPVGFNPDPTAWQVTLSDSTDRAQTPPTDDTWYNLGSGALAMATPIGAWRAGWGALLLGNGATVGTAATSFGHIAATLSTANNSESDKDFSVEVDNYLVVTDATAGHTHSIQSGGASSRFKDVDFAAITTLYLNIRRRGGTAVTSIALFGSIVTSRIIAVSTWL